MTLFGRRISLLRTVRLSMAGKTSIAVVVILGIGVPTLMVVSDRVHTERLDRELNLAVERRDFAAVNHALQEGADPNSRWDYRWTESHHWTDALLDVVKGAPRSVQDMSGNGTALMGAATTGDTALLRLMIAYGADVHLTDRDGATALVYAVKERRLEAATILVH